MRKTSVVVAVSGGLLATFWTAPMAGADPRFHGRSAGGRFDGGHSFRADGRSGHRPGQSFHRHGFGHRRFFPRHFVEQGVVHLTDHPEVVPRRFREKGNALEPL